MYLQGQLEDKDQEIADMNKFCDEADHMREETEKQLSTLKTQTDIEIKQLRCMLA